MKKFCMSIIVIVLIVVGVGFYRGWFALSSSREAESQNIDVKLSVDTDTIKRDADTVTGGLKDEAAPDEK